MGTARTLAYSAYLSAMDALVLYTLALLGQLIDPELTDADREWALCYSELTRRAVHVDLVGLPAMLQVVDECQSFWTHWQQVIFETRDKATEAWQDNTEEGPMARYLALVARLRTQAHLELIAGG